MSRLVTIGFKLTMILSLIQMSILIGVKAQDSEDPSNLLTSYSEIMPGQSMDVFTLPWCATYEEIPQEGIRICSMQPSQGDFVSIRIYIRDHIIQSVIFQSKSLSIGDLPLIWGRPTIVYDGGTYYAHWESGHYAINVPIGATNRFSYWLSVRFLSIEANQSIDESCQQTECSGPDNRLSTGGDVQFAEDFIDVPLYGTDG